MNGILDLAMIHTMSLEQFTRFDYNGSPEYKTAKTVKCYKEEKFEKVLSANGEEIMSRARYYTKTPVEVLDRIDGYDLINAEHLDFGCNYYVAYV